ncbi:MAG: hypothetical protein LIO86_09725 [Lachnospiraceae bacterium]|nr:hypothetical protein [Lachnospiraceae bacterium]
MIETKKMIYTDVNPDDYSDKPVTISLSRAELIAICNSLSFTRSCLYSISGVLQLPGYDFLSLDEAEALETLREKIATIGFFPCGMPPEYCPPRADDDSREGDYLPFT